MAARSYKTEVIRDLFRPRYDLSSGEVIPAIVTLNDVESAIAAYNVRTGESWSTKNPANFFKDLIRVRESANANWPVEVFKAGFGARQVTGEGLCFEFIRIEPDQEVPFIGANRIEPTEATPRHAIESVSLPLASRKLGRNDEPWLIQVIARLRIIETHFSLFSGRNIRQIDLLQLNVKLSKTEIDAIYLAQEETDAGVYREVIVTCEAKTGRDDIIEDQILRQAKAPFRMKAVEGDIVIPIAVKCVAKSLIYIVEFEAIARADAGSTESLVKAADSLFEIRPPVPGIGG